MLENVAARKFQYRNILVLFRQHHLNLRFLSIQRLQEVLIIFKMKCFFLKFTQYLVVLYLGDFSIYERL